MLLQSRESIQSAPANTSRSNAMPDTRTYAHIKIKSVNRQLLTIIPHGLSKEKPPQVKTRGDQLPTDGPDHTTRPKGHHSGQG